MILHFAFEKGSARIERLRLLTNLILFVFDRKHFLSIIIHTDIVYFNIFVGKYFKFYFNKVKFVLNHPVKTKYCRLRS